MRLQWVAFLILGTLGAPDPLAAQALPPGSELTLEGPWTAAVALGPLDEGRYRLEATTLAGDPVEVLVERRSPGGVWSVAGTNRTLRGSLEGWLDLRASGELWRVRPARREPGTIILRLTKTAFGALKDLLQQELTAGPGVTTPLTRRLELPPNTGGASLAAATGADGTLWVGWLTDGGWSAEVWDAAQGRPLAPLSAQTGPWTRLTLAADLGLVVTLTGPDASDALAWSGQAWTDAPIQSSNTLSTSWGRFRTQGTPPRVLQAQDGSWKDLAMPREDKADRILLGSTADGLAVLLASSQSAYRAFYTWAPSRGWLALPPPPSAGPPRADLWAVTAGAGSLYLVEGHDRTLVLRQYDGTQWRTALDLAPLAPRGARAVALLPPTSWSKTGSLVIATDRVTVYDLP